MKHLFFEKGQKQQFAPNHQYLIETSSNLDSKKYILQRIPISVFNSQPNYINNHFYFQRTNNIISYFNCWKQIENVPIQKPIKQKDKKKDKKSMFDIMKRKTKIQVQSSKAQTQHSIAPSKKKINEQGNMQNFTQQQFVYVQMEYFSQIQIPSDFNGIRDLMIIIYLLAKRIEKRTCFIPCMIPVKSQQNDRIKFYKKGVSIEIQLYRLMSYLFKQKQQAYLREWSQQLQKGIHKASINRDQQLIGILLRNSIQQQLKKPYRISLIKSEQKINSIQTVHIVNCETLQLLQSQIELPLQQYEVQYLLKSQNDRQITLRHEIFDKYIIQGKKNNLIVKLLYHLST